VQVAGVDQAPSRPGPRAMGAWAPFAVMHWVGGRAESDEGARDMQAELLAYLMRQVARPARTVNPSMQEQPLAPPMHIEQGQRRQRQQQEQQPRQQPQPQLQPQALPEAWKL
jgi:hypothetical protein